MTSPLDDSGARVVVVSPHLDDGVLSVGAAMARAARRGSRVGLLTIFGCEPSSEASAGGWDERAGFETEGDAARARREEDRRACALLGAVPAWLPFGSTDYERRGDERSVGDAIAAVTEEADVVLLPGSPLTHPDHRWLADVVVRAGLTGHRLGLYAEQPYTLRSSGEPRAPAWLEDALGGRRLVFRAAEATARDRLAKWRAIRQYRSQLPLLGMRRSLRRGPHSLLLGEQIAWPGNR